MIDEKKIKKIMREKNLSQKELAGMVFPHSRQASIRLWQVISAQNDCNLSTAERIAKALGVPLDAILK